VKKNRKRGEGEVAPPSSFLKPLKAIACGKEGGGKRILVYPPLKRPEPPSSPHDLSAFGGRKGASRKVLHPHLVPERTLRHEGRRKDPYSFDRGRTRSPSPKPRGGEGEEKSS